MDKLYYCTKCLRVVKTERNCDYCNNAETKELSIGAPVNILGSKLKGKVIKIKDGTARLVIRDDSNNKFLSVYSAEKMKKLL